MSDLRKYTLVSVLSGSMFWLPIAVSYFEYRNLTVTQGLTIISLYSLLTVILEYPTGVIGDYYSHKISVILGLFFVGVGMCMLSLPGGMMYYFASSAFVSLGLSLLSGSDTALLHSISNNFKHDYAHINSLSLVWVVISTALGSILAGISMPLPYIVTGLTSIIASLIAITISTQPKNKNSGNVFDKAIEGVTYTFKSRSVISYIAIGTLVGTFTISLKWLYNPFFDYLHIPYALWGLVISATMLAIAVGTKLYSTYRNRFSLKSSLIVFVLLTGLLGFLVNLYVSVLLLLGFNVTRGFITTQIDIGLNEIISDSVRASVLSLKSLLIRLVSAGYIFASGFLIENSAFTLLFTVTAVIIGVGSMLSLKTNR